MCRDAHLALVLLWGSLFALPALSQPLPSIDDALLLERMPGASYRMPARLLTPELAQGLKEGKYWGFLPGNAANAKKWLAIPEASWPELISDFAPVCSKGAHASDGGLDPFTGRLYRGATMTEQEFLTTPFVAKTVPDGNLIYAREEDMPADYPARPNRTEMIPHLDGSLQPYRFYVPPGKENAPPAYNSDREHWFCPAGEVWRARLEIIMGKVIPDLMAATFLNDDPRSARQLAVILDRIAEVYPGLPLVSQQIGHGLARNKAGDGYLTREEYLAHPRPFFYGKVAWEQGIYDYNYDKLNGGISGWWDGVMDQEGMLAQAFDLLRDNPAVRAYSEEKYGEEGAWEEKVRKGYLDEALSFCLTVTPTMGNTAYGYVNGAVKFGVVTQNRPIFEMGLSIVELYLANNWYGDGMPNDGAFNYAMMTYGILNYRWMNQFFGGLDLAERYPILTKIDALTPYPVTTLYNVGSKHADEHSRFFRSRRTWQHPPAPDKIPYAEHEASQCFPQYGLTALRAGQPGSRLEMIMDHQNTWNHVHHGKLSLQLFYEGVELLPDFGYSVGYIDPQKAPWKDLTFPYEMMGSPAPSDLWGPWRHSYAMLAEAHNAGMIDHWAYGGLPTRLHRYLGGMPLSDPRYQTQFVDASAEGLYAGRKNPVDTFRRQEAAVTLPSGRSVLVDVFRIRGGRRHDLFWHVPSDPPQTSLGEPKPLPAANLGELFRIRPHYDPETGAAQQHYGRGFQLIEKPERFEMPAGTWRADFLVQPHKFLPQDEMNLKLYGNWPKLLHDVKLRMWGAAFGSQTGGGEILQARGPWPSGMEVFDPSLGRSNEGSMTIVGFKDALTFLIPSRSAQEPGLESTFVQVLEPYNADQAPALESVTIEEGRPLDEGGGVLVRLRPPGGTEGDEALVATTPDGRDFRTPTFRLQGQMGMVCAAGAALTLYDGSALEGQGWKLALQPTLRLRLLGIIGDLTGTPKESALIVESAQPLPEGTALAGTMLFVYHRADARYSTGYTIASVHPYGEGRWRLDLLDNPTFIEEALQVRGVEPANPTKLVANFRLYKGSGTINFEHRRIRFPRSGFETALISAGGTGVEVAEAPPAGAVQAGDPFIIYVIQPGDEVVIPSSFACNGKQTDEGLLLEVAATGVATLTVPGAYTRASVVAPEQAAVALPVQRAGETLILKIEPQHLINGRATLLLAR